MKRGFVLCCIAALALFAVVASEHNVSTVPTERDRRAAADVLDGTPRRPDTFEGEVRLIRAVQNAVLRAAPVDKGIPLGEARELADLKAAGKGLCYDRSRAIETILRVAGFETRHLAVYSTEDYSTFGALLTPQVPSHALTEVLTRRGWMLVDSNERWIGLTRDGSVRGIEGVGWRGGWASPDPINPIFRGPHVAVYGLYSRHGMFYPPYNPLPDVNWRELLANVP